MAAILTLRLSSPSFLETILTDNGIPLYSTETTGNTTTLSRCDPFHGLTAAAHIHWPEQRSGKGKTKRESSSSSSLSSSSRRYARITMNGSVCSEEDLLKRNCLNTSRKFRIPGHSETLKWRRVQGLFQCVSSHGTPIAVFEPAVYTSTARLGIFVPTLPGLPEPQGCVSQPLLDYLLVTALLLLTHPEDWHGFAASMSTPSLVSGHAMQMPRAVPPPVPALQTTPPASPLAPSPFSAEPHFSHFPQQQPPHQQRYSHPLTHARSHAHLSIYSSSSSFDSSSTRAPPSPTSSTRSSTRVSEKQRHLSVVNYDEPQQVMFTPAQPRAMMQSPLQLAQESQFQSECGEIIPGEAPPPYEEIQWTVRVRQPRRRRDQQTV